MTEYDRLSLSPVLEIDLRAIFNSDRTHRFLLCVLLGLARDFVKGAVIASFDQSYSRSGPSDYLDANIDETGEKCGGDERLAELRVIALSRLGGNCFLNRFTLLLRSATFLRMVTSMSWNSPRPA